MITRSAANVVIHLANAIVLNNVSVTSVSIPTTHLVDEDGDRYEVDAIFNDGGLYLYNYSLFIPVSNILWIA